MTKSKAMETWNSKIFVLVSIIGCLSTVVAHDQQITCKKFLSIMAELSILVEAETSTNTFLERIGIVSHSSIFKTDSYDTILNNKVKKSELFTIGAEFFKNQFNMCSDNFESLAKKCMKQNCKMANRHLKYRPIDGRGNNLKNPEWGASDTPFARHGSKNYDDGINTIKKSVDGLTDLPNARLLVREVLMKAVRSPPPTSAYNLMALLIILLATHDLHYQVPVHYRKNEIGCCSKDNRNMLPPYLTNPACLPIEVSKEDPFYKHGNIGCLNMVRSQLGTYDCGAQAGQTLNRATAFMDLSLIYGNRIEELRPIRLYKSGKLRMGKNQVLPVDSNGEHLPSMNRFTAIPIASIWPALFARNHNHLAGRLAKLNPQWSDEITFQEARRINIANFQFNLITAKSIERVFNRVINASYSDERNVATFLEFSFAYRGGHYYLPSKMLFQSENYTETEYFQSDTIGKIELLENSFDEALRGATNQPCNVGQYSDEIVNRIGKNSQGYGTDLIATDIQRGRDNGIPSFVEIRRRCNLTPEINSLDDFKKIFNQTNVDLLKKFYTSHEDVDFYVGGMLEAFESVGNPLAGPTFGCVIGENYNNVMGGDIYYYSHPENPYPFSEAQIDAVHNYAVSNIYCTNSKLNETNALWSYAPFPQNPKVDCKHFPPMDLSAWKE